MGLFSRWFKPSDEKAVSLRKLLEDTTGWANSASGKTVNYSTAIQVATVFAVCKVIGEGIAQVPLKIMQETKDGRTRIPATKHPLYNLLYLRPNEFQTSFEYREMIAWHTILCGSHYSFINRAANGKIYELVPFSPSQVEVKRADDLTLTYEITTQKGEKKVFPAESIWHIKGPSWNGWQGLEAVKLARDAIGLAMVTEEAANSLHKNGVRASGAYSVDGTLKPDQYKDLAEWIKTHNAGAANAGKPLILDRNAKWLASQMSGVDAQSYETRRFQIEEICRFARVMPIMVGHADKTATYASAEQMFLAHLVHTLAPWYQRLEQSIDVNLLTEKDRAEGYYSNFVEEGMLRGAAKDTKDVILGYVNGGIMTPNEGRAKLDMNPDPDPDSDKLRIPANITGSVPDADEKKPDPNAKAIEDLHIKFDRLEARKPEQPIINVDARTEVHNDSQPISFTVTSPDIKVDPQVTVNVPEQKEAQITIEATMPSPEIVVNVPEPNVTLEATMPTPQVIVSMPPRKTDTTVERDAAGNITRATQIETDA